MQMESKKKLWRGFALFMAVMLIMTYVSRMVYVSRMPRVKWSYPASASIRNKITAEGTVEAVGARAVIGLDGLLVEKVCVAAGDRMEAGTVLYEVNMEDLLAQLAELHAQEEAWQKQEQAKRRETAVNTTRAQEDYDMNVIELDRRIAEETKELEELMEDLDTHMFRIPEEDASDETWIAWADERLRFDRRIAEKERLIEDIQLEKEKILRQADREVEDARRAQSAAESGLKLGASGISQMRERQERIALLTEFSENGGKVAAGCTEGVMELDSTSEIYDFVIPIKALHNDGGNTIYVLEEKEGILGTELSVRSMTVRLLDRNEEYAAIADELLSGDLKVVTDCDRELKNGRAVKE